MTNLEKIHRALRDKNTVLILPNALKKAPVHLRDWQKEDENNNLVENSYYLVEEIADMFNLQLPKFGENHFIFVYGLRQNGETVAIHEVLKAHSLIDVRENKTGEFALEPKAIDFKVMPLNAYAIFSFAEYREIDMSVFEENIGE